MSEVTEIAHGALVAQGLSSTQGKGFKLTQGKHEIQHPNPEGLRCFQKISPATENYTGRFWPLRALSLNQNIHGLQESGCSRLPKDARSPQVEPRRALGQHQGYLTVWPLNGLDAVDSHSAYFLDPKQTQKLQTAHIRPIAGTQKSCKRNQYLTILAILNS